MKFNLYDEVETRCDKIDLYNNYEIDITLLLEIDNTSELSRPYRISKIEFKSDIHESPLYKDLDTFIKKLNVQIQEINNESSKSWQVFYLYKEIFQFIQNKYKFNYFRGQRKDWKLLPGILRKETSSEFRHEFERIYKKVSEDFPEKVEYIPFKKNMEITSFSERVKQLSMLQHYGFNTSLIDLTENPYIAMLFMISGSNRDELDDPVIDCFSINEEHKMNNLFVTVKKDSSNQRIIAQKGAFLCFDNLSDIAESSIQKINRIRIKINIENKEDEIFSKYEELKTKITENENGLNTGFKNHMIKNIHIFGQNRSELNKEFNRKRMDAFRYIKTELGRKLEEFHYYEKDLFPDFEQYIKYTMENYENSNKLQVSET
ncbi:FRG domain-containing protein [Facklamia sp. 7083-14-GEN3]|uniref:FRG domain-containing protein n=1 Tax=Facklamia sp. 7083-14-GEN3 TaxID=2973478 RepID=UPI00215C2F94|nr:FRG domain-containing protein [Facklamia sp. 7083-14-GEN3]MCR8969597.1 FRG domain-containing protein [Facklamia sp. 7083-14-GEN3]